MKSTQIFIASVKKLGIIVMCVMTGIGLVSCSSNKSYPLLETSDYSQSLMAYYNSDSIQTIEQSFFEVKLTK